MDQIIVYALWTKLSFGLVALIYGFSTIRSRRLKAARIQGDTNMPNAGELRRRQLVTARNLALISFLIVTGSILTDFVSTEPIAIATFCAQVGFMVLGTDLYEYLLHRLMHGNRWLFVNVHSFHHRVTAPVASDYLYVHPIEAVSVGGSFVVIGAFVVVIWGHLSAWALFGWGMIRLSHALDSHSGLHSRIAKRIPLFAEAEHHDLHHSSRQQGNYGSLTHIWDMLLGTSLRAPAPRKIQ